MSIILVYETVPHGIATKNTLFLFIHTIGHEFIFYKITISPFDLLGTCL